MSNIGRSILRTTTTATARLAIGNTVPFTYIHPLHATSGALLRPTQSASLDRLSSISKHFSTSTVAMAPTPKQYDFIVIGGGSGGSGSARRASGWYKAKTCIIDAGVSGGCCVNVGYVGFVSME